MSNITCQFSSRSFKYRFLFFSHYKYSAGFTIIELLIVFAVFSILSAVSVISFVQYTKAQTLTNATRDMHQAIALAKSRAQSQVKPDACSDQTLTSYTVRFCTVPTKDQTCLSGGDYEVVADCSGGQYLAYPQDGRPQKLPQDISFDPDQTDTTAITFSVINGGVQGLVNGKGHIGIKDASGTLRRITVDQLGNVNEDL